MSCKYMNQEKDYVYCRRDGSRRKVVLVTVMSPLLENDLRNGYGGCLSNGI